MGPNNDHCGTRHVRHDVTNYYVLLDFTAYTGE